VSQAKGTQRLSDIRGLTATHPVLGWSLLVGVCAIAGLPPLGIFMSEFLVVSSTVTRQPLLALILVAGLLVGFGGLLRHAIHICFGPPQGNTAPLRVSYVPMFAHLGLVAMAGVYIPRPVLVWFQHVASLLG
jgi:hydrogenase-4 component F